MSSCVLRSAWILLLCISSVQTENTVQSTTSAHVVHLGKTATINCDYNKTSEKETFRVYLRREQLLCSYFHQLKSWRKQSCKENIRLIWIPETEEVSFELVNLQINDTGVYTCAVERLTPPPVQTLGNQRTSLHVIAHPAVFVSCVRGSNGVSAILCASEGFYPAAVEQAWIRDGEFITYLNISNTFTHTKHLNTSAVHYNSSINPDGTHSLSLYLHLLTLTPEQVIYSCWVNHSSLSQPITVNISSTECSEKEDVWTGVIFISVVISFGVLIVILLTLEVQSLLQ
ncbi:uncharacterized protein LOC107196917 [Astyanax mexicanus]|uniref:uncharacterized protein LOC107196917 n=1 Tax=Astyanax mexicanus TaxID=7994 RepID=UPI0020CAF2AF|nr:uncharacterized protein LOC107196917 [Astyanax mexicanus]